jgi:alpha-2-macroglobulin
VGRLSVPVTQLHRAGSSTLTITRQATNGNIGRGVLYYVANLRYYLNAAGIAPRNQGAEVHRSYRDLAGRTVQAAPAGSVVQVVLTLRTGQTLEYLDIEDPIPAGLEPIDPSLQTSRQGLFGAWQVPAHGQTNLAPYLDHTDLRDDRISLYAHALPPGTYEYTYLAQASTAGRFDVAPTSALETFFPDVFGRSAGTVFTVTR